MLIKSVSVLKKVCCVFDKVSSKPGLDEDFIQSKLSVQTLHSHSEHRLSSVRDLVNLVQCRSFKQFDRISPRSSESKQHSDHD